MAGTEGGRGKVEGLCPVYQSVHFSAVESKLEALKMSEIEEINETGTVGETEPVAQESDVEKPELAPVEEITGIMTAIYQMEAVTGRIHKLVDNIKNFDQKTADSILKIKNKAVNEPEYSLLLSLNPDWENNLKKGVESQRKALTAELGNYKPYVTSISEKLLNMQAKYGFVAPKEEIPESSPKTGTKSGKKAGNRIWTAEYNKISPELKTKHEMRAERESGEDYLRVYFNGSEKGTVFKSNLPKAVIDEMNA